MMDLQQLSPTTLWTVFGIILLILEIFTMSFFLAFFGISALVVALCKFALGLDHISYEIILFTVLGVGGILVFRKKLRKSCTTSENVDIDRGQEITVSEKIPANGTGKIKYQGSKWSAVNESTQDLQAGQKAIIKKIEGTKLILTDQ